jgi:hypothetical protein
METDRQTSRLYPFGRALVVLFGIDSRRVPARAA